MRAAFFVVAGLGLGFLLAAACGSSTSPDETCANCVDEVVACHKASNGNYKGSLCLGAGLTDDVLDYECTAKFGFLGAVEGEYAPCDGIAGGTWQGDDSDGGPPATDGADDTGGATTCVEWRDDATDAVTLNSSTGVYHVDETFIDSLAENPSPLANCDDARVEPPVVGSMYTVVSANSSTLLYKLGLRNGDEIRKINGMPLSGMIDGAQAFGDLILRGATTSFALVVKRSGSYITINYVLE